MFQNKPVFCWDENKEQTWGLGGPFSHSCAAQGQHVMDGLGLPPLSHRHRDELNAFLEGLKCPWWFSFLPALIVGKHSFIRFSCRIARAPGNTGAIAPHRHTVPEMLSQPVLPLCRN